MRRFRNSLFILVLFSIGLVAGFSGCTTQIDYFGESQPPTAQVELFFNAEEIGRPYRVMGEFIATVPRGSRVEQLQADLLEAARLRGADALLVEQFEAVREGETQTVRVFPPGASHSRGDVYIEHDFDENIEVRAKAVKFRE